MFFFTFFFPSITSNHFLLPYAAALLSLLSATKFVVVVFPFDADEEEIDGDFDDDELPPPPPGAIEPLSTKWHKIFDTHPCETRSCRLIWHGLCQCKNFFGKIMKFMKINKNKFLSKQMCIFLSKFMQKFF